MGPRRARRHSKQAVATAPDEDAYGSDHKAEIKVEVIDPTAPDHRTAALAWRMVTLVAAFALVVAHVVAMSYWVPPVKPPDAPAHVFSEGRAFHHITHLAETIGWRQVSTPGVEVAANYVYAEALKIKALADASPKRQVRVEVTFERFGGGINMQLFDAQITNSFRNLSVVSWYVEPARAAGKPAVMVVAHFDSPIAGPGASDDASCVSIQLEAARALVAAGTQLDHPVLFVANGGEETFSQAMRGFMTQSQWRERLAAFINLESTGPWGPPIVFQGTTPWVVAAYGSAEGQPSRGSSMGQDFFDLKLIPADTDYRMMALTHYGTLPGIDIAYVLDAAAYHTDRDTPQRIRPGTIQELGEKVVVLVETFGHALSRGTNTPAHLRAERTVYFNTGYRHAFISYSWRVARVLHTLPLAIYVSVVITLAVRAPDGFPTAAGHLVLQTGIAALRWSALLVSAIVAAAALGGLRAFLTGKVMVWFSRPTIIWPLSGLPVFAVLCFSLHRLPKLGGVSGAFARLAVHERPASHVVQLAEDLLGAALMHSIAAAALVGAGVTSSFFSAYWAFTAWALLGAVWLVPSAAANALVPALVTAPASAMSVSILGVLVNHILGKSSMTGASPTGVLDAVVAVLASSLLVTSWHLFVPFALHWLQDPALQSAHVGAMPVNGNTGLGSVLGVRWSVRRVAALSAVLAVLASAGASWLQPYSDAYPKRALVMAIHREGDEDDLRLVVCTMDATPPLIPGAHGRLSDVPSQGGLKLAPTPSHPRDLESFFPLNDKLGADAYSVLGRFGGSGLDQLREAMYRSDTRRQGPPVAIVKRGQVEAAAESTASASLAGTELQLAIRAWAPTWSVMNVTVLAGALLGSSLSDDGLAPAPIKTASNHSTHMFRMASNGDGSLDTHQDSPADWPFSLIVSPGTQLEVSASFSFLKQTELALELRQLLPSWAHLMFATVYQVQVPISDA